VRLNDAKQRPIIIVINEKRINTNEIDLKIKPHHHSMQMLNIDNNSTNLSKVDKLTADAEFHGITDNRCPSLEEHLQFLSTSADDDDDSMTLLPVQTKVVSVSKSRESSKRGST
jgi:hypothetical protein